MPIIAIDGPAGAGKTTLATKLCEDFAVLQSVAVVHMDDLYSGWNNALSNSLTLKLSEIVDAYLAREEFKIQIFNWVTMSFDSWQMIKPHDILIIEGVGAGQKVVREAGAVLYWLDVEPDVGLARVLNRDGFQIEQQMRQWQADQELHFASDLTRTHADHILST